MANGAVADYNKTNLDTTYNAALKAIKQAYSDTLKANNAAAAKNKEDIKKNYDAKRKDAYVNARLSAIGNNENLASKGVAGALYDSAKSGMSETSRIAADNTLRNNINSLNTGEAADKSAADLEAVIANYDADKALLEDSAKLYTQKSSDQVKDNQFAAQYALDNFDAYLAAHELQNEIGLNLLSKTTAKAAANELKKYGKVKTKATAELLGVAVGTSAEKVLAGIISSSLLK